MKVIHIVRATPYGGAQALVAQLAAAQRAEGVDAQILAIYSGPEFFRELGMRGVPYKYIEARARFYPPLWGKIIKDLKAFKPEILCFHNASWVFLAMSLTMAKACPWVYHAHSYPPTSVNIRNWLTKICTMHKIDAVIGVSESVSQAFKQHYGAAIKVYRTIYNGIDLPTEISGRNNWPDFMGEVSPGRPLVGMATRFAEDKGVKEFLDAITSISRYLPEARYVLAGEGPMLAWAQTYAAQLNLLDKLAFPGFLRDMPRFWSSLDFALFTSPREPFGLRLIEPQSIGTVVAGYFNGSGSDEIIVPGETGIFVPWGQRQELAAEIMALWSDPARYQQIAVAARNRVQMHFSLTQMSKKSIEFYQELIR